LTSTEASVFSPASRGKSVTKGAGAGKGKPKSAAKGVTKG